MSSLTSITRYQNMFLNRDSVGYCDQNSQLSFPFACRLSLTMYTVQCMMQQPTGWEWWINSAVLIAFFFGNISAKKIINMLSHPYHRVHADFTKFSVHAT